MPPPASIRWPARAQLGAQLSHLPPRPVNILAGFRKTRRTALKLRGEGLWRTRRGWGRNARGGCENSPSLQHRKGVEGADHAEAHKTWRREQPGRRQPSTAIVRGRGKAQVSSKVRHGCPVWFIDGNPVVGYSATAKAVSLLFWNGRSFQDVGLKPAGKHQAAQAQFSDCSELDPEAIRRWLKQARSNVLDSRAYFRNLRETRTRAAGRA